VADDYDDAQAAERGFRIADHYGVAVYRAGELYVAVEDIFYIGSPLRFSFGQNPNGLCALRLAYSHNGMNWRRPKGRPAWLEVGEPGDFDAGFMVTANTFVEVGDELWLYYGGSRYDHGWCINPDFSLRADVPLEAQNNSGEIGLARIKRDRFASLAATYRGRFHVEVGQRAGDALLVNALCPKGEVRVAVVDERTQEALPGLDLEDCVPVTGDHIRAPVHFRQADIAQVPRDMRTWLRFEVCGGDVFGFEWGSDFRGRGNDF
jgi:hypothetical protein